MKKELMDKKFAELSDMNKIRYNLGNIILLQHKIILIIGGLGSLIFGYLLFIPLVIKYGGVNRMVVMGGIGLLLLIVTFILFWVGIFKLDKLEKSLEEFLNKNSKKK